MAAQGTHKSLYNIQAVRSLVASARLGCQSTAVGTDSFQPAPFAVYADVDGVGCALTLVIAVHDITAGELKAIAQGPLMIAIVPSTQTVSVVLGAETMMFEVPIALGVETGKDQRVISGALTALKTKPQSILCDIRLIEASSGDILKIRSLRLSNLWANLFACALLKRHRPMSRVAYERAIAADRQRWPSIPAMLIDAHIIERIAAINVPELGARRLNQL